MKKQTQKVIESRPSRWHLVYAYVAGWLACESVRYFKDENWGTFTFNLIISIAFVFISRWEEKNQVKVKQLINKMVKKN